MSDRQPRETPEVREAFAAACRAGHIITLDPDSPQPSWQAPVRAADRARGTSDEPDLPVGAEITIHVTGRVVSCWRGVLTVAVPTADGAPEHLTVDLTAPAVTIRARRW